MKRFNEYKEEKIYEGLLGDIYTKVKGAASYFFDKAKKALLLAISPESIDGYNKGGVRVATQGEELPQVREAEPYYGKEETSQVEKRNIKAFIAAMSSASGDINEAAVDGFADGFMAGGIAAGASQVASGGFKIAAKLGAKTGKSGGIKIGNTKILSPDAAWHKNNGGTLLKIGKTFRIDVGSNTLLHMHLPNVSSHIQIGTIGAGIYGGLK